MRINKTVAYDDYHFENYIGSATQYNEFTPKWRQTESVPSYFKPEDKIKIVNGKSEILNLKYNSSEILADIKVDSDSSLIRINKNYFPETKVKVNGVTQKIGQDVEVLLTDNFKEKTELDTSGLMHIYLKKGLNKLEFKYEETTVRLIGNLLTLSGSLFILIALLRNVKK